jgi:hypothetical protein
VGIVRINTALAELPQVQGPIASDLGARAQITSYFIVAVLGFSFWFFIGVPFASHRETYWWLAMVQTKPFAQAFGIISSTYRPIAQGLTWTAFLILNPRIFPTSVVRQALLQGFIYGMFVLAWWLIYSSAPQKRVFAIVACVAGAVFFSGYVHLFHIYGLFYVAVMLTLGALLYFYSSGTFEKREVWFAIVATLLVFWHPFATALFVGFYFGFCVETFGERNTAQGTRSVIILLFGLGAIAAMAVVFARTPMPLQTRLVGFLVSYKTNEVNRVASAVAFAMTQLVIYSMSISAKQKVAAVLLVCALSVLFLFDSIPILLLWICAALIKLWRSRRWSLFFLTLAASLLPFGGGIGTPMYGLFAIILSVYVTAFGFQRAQNALSAIGSRYILGFAVVTAALVLIVRTRVNVPVVTRLATPLLAERERTYQLEDALYWLHKSNYCSYQVEFAENAGSPVESVESALSRRNRPPASLGDVQLFWTTVLQCRQDASDMTGPGTVVVTFGGQSLSALKPVYKLEGKYAGETTVWVSKSQN